MSLLKSFTVDFDFDWRFDKRDYSEPSDIFQRSARFRPLGKWLQRWLTPTLTVPITPVLFHKGFIKQFSDWISVSRLIFQPFKSCIKATLSKILVAEYVQTTT